MDEAWTVTDFGTVHVHGRRTGDNGRVIEVQRSYEIVPEPVVNGVSTVTPSDCEVPTAVRASQTLSGMPVNATWHAITGAVVQHIGATAPASAGHYIVSRAGCPAARITVY